MTLDEEIAQYLAAPEPRVLMQKILTARATDAAERAKLIARIAELEKAAVVVPPAAEKPLWASDWKTSPADGGWNVQEFVKGRATLVPTRDGRKGVRLHTEPGDALYGVNVDRNDLALSQQLTDGYEGRQAWWSHSILFPDDFNAGTSWYVAADFHNTSDVPGMQANFHVDCARGVLSFRGYGGTRDQDNQYGMPIESIIRNKWYEFVYHVGWSATNGFFDSWVNGKRYLRHQGPTLYVNDGVYLKLANYHQTHGQASSIIHDRVMRGKTAASVSLGPLE